MNRIVWNSLLATICVCIGPPVVPNGLGAVSSWVRRDVFGYTIEYVFDINSDTFLWNLDDSDLDMYLER